jgi:hypothetical protein
MFLLSVVFSEEGDLPTCATAFSVPSGREPSIVGSIPLGSQTAKAVPLRFHSRQRGNRKSSRTGDPNLSSHCRVDRRFSQFERLAGEGKQKGGLLVSPNPRGTITGCGGPEVLALAEVPLGIRWEIAGWPLNSDSALLGDSLTNAPTRPIACGWSVTSALSSRGTLP